MTAMYWHNFATGTTDYRTMPTRDDEVKQYLPQEPAALNLFELYRQRGETTADAMIKVLQACVGIDVDDNGGA
jgi:hypothetical protein